MKVAVRQDMNARVEQIVCARFGITRRELRNRSRKQRFSWPRHVLFWLLHTEYGLTQVNIADQYNQGDHTTVFQACRHVRIMSEAYPLIKAELASLRAQILATIPPPHV